MNSDMNPIPQAGAIPIKDGKVCLITSSSGKRWGIPKGMIELDQTPEECALQESWEEAGLEGDIVSEVVGTYKYKKWGSTFEVSLFLMSVTKELNRWPEQTVRKRRWFKPAEVVDKISDDTLCGIVKEILEEYDF